MQIIDIVFENADTACGARLEQLFERRIKSFAWQSTDKQPAHSFFKVELLRHDLNRAGQLINFHRLLPAFDGELIDVLELETLARQIMSDPVHPDFTCMIAGD